MSKQKGKDSGKKSGRFGKVALVMTLLLCAGGTARSSSTGVIADRASRALAE